MESIGLPAKQSKVNRILIIMTAVFLGGMLISFITGYFAYRSQRNAKIPEFDSSIMKDYYGNTQTQTEWQSSGDKTAECMKQLYGKDVFEKMMSGKFIPPADIGMQIKKCVERENK